MNEWQRSGRPTSSPSWARRAPRPTDIVSEDRRRQHTAYVTPEGAAWLASASAFPSSVEALWSARPTSPSVLPCGTVFDVVNLPALFGRRVLEQLWAAGPGSGPVAVHRGRVLLLAAPGTAQRLPSLLGWEEWGRAVPPMLCHGAGDAVTVPALYAGATTRASPYGPGYDDAYGDAYDDGYDDACADAYAEDSCPEPEGGLSRWVVAPDTREPWLPGPDVLLWACVRAARPAPGTTASALVSTPGTA